MQPIPYLFFRTGTRQAFEAYGRIFGATPEITTFADMPVSEGSPAQDAPGDAVMHAALRLGEGWIYGSDDPSGKTPAMAGCSLHVDLPDAAETRRVWDALAEGGEIGMPLEPTFWTPLFGTLTDRFGTRWMISQVSAD